MRTISKGLASLKDSAENAAKSQDSDEQKSGKCFLVREGVSKAITDYNESFSGSSSQPDTILLPRVWTGAQARAVLLAVEGLSLRPTPNNMINIDLSRVEHIDSSGLGALVALRKIIARKHMTASLINVDQHIRSLLETANFDRLFEIK